jgi:hypothetical protein
MKRTSWLAAALALAISGAAYAAEADSRGVPYPSRELQKLSSFVGTWRMTGEMMKSPMGPGGKMDTTEHCSWYEGDYFLTCHVEGSGPMGKSTGMEIFGYDAQDKVYTYTSFDSLGMQESAKGTVDGNRWTWTNELKMAGKMMKSRFLVTQVSPDENAYSWSMSPDGQTWSEVFKATAKREKGAKKPAAKKK